LISKFKKKKKKQENQSLHRHHGFTTANLDKWKEERLRQEAVRQKKISLQGFQVF